MMILNIFDEQNITSIKLCEAVQAYAEGVIHLHNDDKDYKVRELADTISWINRVFLLQTDAARRNIENIQTIDVKDIDVVNNSHWHIIHRYMMAKQMLSIVCNDQRENHRKNHQPIRFLYDDDFLNFMESNEKEALNKAIEDLNSRLLSDSDVKVWTVDECINYAEKFMKK